MIIDLADVFLNVGRCVEKKFSFDMSDLVINDVSPFISPVDADVIVRNCAGLVTAYISVSFAFVVPCDRCFKTFSNGLNYKFSHILVSGADESFDNDFIALKEYKLDLDELLKSDILLEIPSKNLCKDDCKGICPECGKDLNEAGCSCTEYQIDPRLEALKKLID